jgi:hypothetical protein
MLDTDHPFRKSFQRRSFLTTDMGMDVNIAKIEKSTT